MAGKEKPNMVHQNAIHVETIRKEQTHQKLHTEFGINPYRKFHVPADNPMSRMSRKPTEAIADNSAFIEAFHKAKLEPNKKYSMPQTTSQEIGWLSTPLIPSNLYDKRLNFHRRSTAITKQE
ncbi:hypothetical protein VZT92_022329 [Zoarces viviparus]|uniref:Protein FAM183A n=1 Tax=Zoarces viviparus TaxID=48416 RepID=A0AAW1EAM9_ZOAVI